MMNQKRRFPISPILLFLDMLASVSIALGLAGQFANTHFIPEAYRFQYYELVLIGLGVMILIPTAGAVLRSLRAQKGHH